MPLLTPLSERFKPHALLKQGRYSVASLVLELADQHARVAKLVKQPPGDHELRLLEGIDRSARILKSLSHPNLTPFDKIVEGQGGTWMFYQWTDGSPLSDYYGLENTIDERWIVWWLTQMLQGLSALHRNDPPLVVGYLDPSDVVINNEKLIIVDFGIFEDIFPEVAAGMLSQLPTACFIAPERLNSTDTLPSADLFSVSAIAFWMATGHTPIINSPQVGRAHLAALQQARPKLPPEVARLIVQGLSFHAAERPPSAEDMLAAVWPHAHDMRGQIAPAPPAVDNVQYRAQTTRMFSTEVPSPISLDPNAPLPSPAEEPRAEKETLLDALLPGRRKLVAALVLIAVVGAFSFRSVGARLLPVSEGWMRVTEGHVKAQNDHRKAGEPRWSPVDRVAPGALLMMTGDEASLEFGSKSHLTLESHAQIKNYGLEDHHLSVMVFGGAVKIHTSSVDTISLHLPPGTVVTVQPMSEMEIDLTGHGTDPKIVLSCQMGQSSVRLGNSQESITSGQTARLTLDGRQLLR